MQQWCTLVSFSVLLARAGGIQPDNNGKSEQSQEDRQTESQAALQQIRVDCYSSLMGNFFELGLLV